MNKYLHAIGFAAGLVAVIFVSAADGFLITERGAVSVPLTQEIFALCWLFSYVLTAWLIGEYAVDKKTRKRVFIPILFLLGTVGLFWAFYRMQSVGLSIAFCIIDIVLLLITLKIMIKHAFYACFITVVLIAWYALILFRLLFH